jgi:hypothetical protein
MDNTYKVKKHLRLHLHAGGISNQTPWHACRDARNRQAEKAKQ